MQSLANLTFSGKSFCKLNFSGGNLSSNTGMLLFDKFLRKIGFYPYIESVFQHPVDLRDYSDLQLLLQKIFLIVAGYSTDSMADYLYADPVLLQILGGKRIASQPTLSRFYARLNDQSLKELETALKWSRKRAYRIQEPKRVIFDVDTTMIKTCGKQEDSCYVYHYADTGYHPILCFDGNNGDLLKAELRPGNTYCGTDSDTFLRPLFEEYQQEYPDVSILVRGDSGFAMPELYSCIESFSHQYIIRLKKNPNLQKKAQELIQVLMKEHQQNPQATLSKYSEFQYQADSWDKARRVIVKAEYHPKEGQPRCGFFVTNCPDEPEKIVHRYCQRGNMENFIKELKNGFVCHLSSHDMIINKNRFAIAALAYNLFQLFRRFCLPLFWKDYRIQEIRLALFRIASRKIQHARKTVFKADSNSPFQYDFYRVYSNIEQIC